MATTLLNGVVIPAHYMRLQKHQDEVCTLCISFKSIDGLPSGKAGGNSTVRLDMFLYDTAYRQFFGRCWRGPEVPVNGKINVEYNFNAYLHSTIFISDNFLLVVQAVAVRDLKSVLCGWGFIRPFKDGAAPLLDSSSSKVPIPTFKMDMYFGSPRGLILLNEPIENTGALKNINGLLVSYAISHHDSMENAIGLFPENIIVGQNDTVTGLLKKDKDPFWRPRFQKTINCLIESIRVYVNPTLQEFEQELRNRLNEDRLNRFNLATDASASVDILERRLHVGVHNGWTYVEPPEILNLIVERAHKDSEKVKSADGSRVHSSWLFARNKVHIEEIVEDKRCVLVFTLEYIVSEPASLLGVTPAADKLRSLKKGTTRHVYLRVGEINPLSEQPSADVVLKLQGALSARKFKPKLLFKEASRREDPSQLAVEVGFRFTREDLQAPAGPQAVAKTLPAVPAPAPSQLDSEEMVMRQTVPKVSAPAPVPEPVRPQPQPFLPMDSSQLAASWAYQAQGYPYGFQPMMFPFPSAPGMMRRDFIGAKPGEATELAQLALATSRAHNIPIAPATTQTVSRAAYARLYAAGFPSILDRKGEHPEVIDSQSAANFDVGREDNDPLAINEVVVQLLAFSRYDKQQTSLEQCDVKSVYFTYQFYRFPQSITERLLLSKQGEQTALSDADPASQAYSAPFVLQREDPNSQKVAPGYMLRYCVDPTYMSVGEKRMFLEYLQGQALHIDVWDGDSLMLIGSCAVELRRLCRQGCEAVQVTYELDVMHTEYIEDSHADQTTTALPVRIKMLPRGKLHLRLANIGYPVDVRQSKRDFTSERKRYVVRPQSSSQLLGSTGNVELPASEPLRTIAAPLTARNRELAEMLSTRKSYREGDAAALPPEEQNATIGDGVQSDRLRKMRRMQAIRQHERMPQPTQFDNNAQFQSFMAYRESRSDKARDLQTIDQYRQTSKKDVILDALQSSITTKHTIWASFGSTEFFEYEFVNKSNKSHTIYIQCHDPELQIVQDVTEWRHYKMLYGLDTPLPEHFYALRAQQSLQDTGTGTGPVGLAATSSYFTFYVQPKETLHVPFKYLSMQADHTVLPSTPPKASSETLKLSIGTSQLTSARKSSDSKHVKVVFMSAENNTPFAVLDLHVVSQPHVVDQTFRFYHPEQTFLKKSIRLPPPAAIGTLNSTTPGYSQLLARCSDPTVIAETHPTPQGEPHDVLFKVALGAAPQVKRFFMAVYGDPFCSRPVQIWQFYVHAMQRVDVSCSEGQKSKFSLILRGTQASRLAQAYSSHNELEVMPREAFMLAANTVCELAVNLKSQHAGNRYMRVHVVDVEYKQLLRAWLVCLSCRPPVINKAFELKMPVGGGKESNKTIRYANPYPTKKTFVLKTNREDLLQFKDAQLSIPAGGNESIGLRFVPVTTAGAADILVFINDEDDKTEEAFCIRVTYA